MKKYPNRVYDGITDDDSSWGMCCSEKMAKKCAEDWYDKYGRLDFCVTRLFESVILAAKFLVAMLFGAVVYAPIDILLGKYILEQRTYILLAICAVLIILAVYSNIKYLHYRHEYKIKREDYEQYNMCQAIVWMINPVVIISIYHCYSILSV